MLAVNFKDNESVGLDQLHPKVISLLEKLKLTNEEQERFWWVIEDISNYYLGFEKNLKRIYRGVGGTLFWGWDLGGKSPEENVWLSEISPLESDINLHNLDWDRINSTNLLQLTRDITLLLKGGSINEIKSVVITGESSTHKSIVSKAILNFAKTFTTVAYLNLPALQEAVIGTGFDEQRRILNLAKEVGILVLDELGLEVVSDYFRDSWIYKIVSNRASLNLPTILITNFSLEQLEIVEAGAKPTAFTRLKARQLIKRIKTSYGIIVTDDSCLEKTED